MSLEGKGPNVFQPVKIAPSILSADFMNLQRDIEAIQAGGAGYVHVDVMDGHFVPNLTMGVPVVKQLKKITDMPLDVHLMISNPLEQLPWFLEAGAAIVTRPAEAAAGSGSFKHLPPPAKREGGVLVGAGVFVKKTRMG